MEYSSPYTKPRFPFSELNSPIHAKPTSQGKSYSNLIYKVLFLALFLVILPLFPSQAPDYVDTTIFTKFWELLHLMFVGIAVSYGLFSSRTAQIRTESHPNIDTRSYLSRKFHFTSIFDDDFEDPYGSDEKSMIQSWISQSYGSKDVIGNLSTVGDEECEPHFSILKNNHEFSCESTVVIAQSNHGMDKRFKSGHVSDYKPLGLPVRSLKSRVGDSGSDEFVNGSESDSGSKSSCKSCEKCGRRDFGDLGPVNLEENFDEAFRSSSSPIPWRSRSLRTGTRVKIDDFPRPSHFRPLSIDETQFGSLKSSSFRSTVSASSQTSSGSSSSSGNNCPRYSSCSEHSKSKMEGQEEKTFHGSSPFASASIPTELNDKTSLNSLHFKRYGIRSLSEKQMKESSEDGSRESNVKRRDDLSDSIESELNGMNHIKLAKIPSRVKSAKSVRTIRANRVSGTYRNPTDDNIRKKLDETEAEYMRKDERGARGSCMANNNYQKLGYNSLPKPTFSNHSKKESEFSDDGVTDNSEDNSESEAEGDNFKVNSDGALPDVSSEAGSDAHEVDKKAGEFIAKFREQIKLQKMASVERSRGLTNSFR